MSENTKDTLTKSIDKTKENEEKKKDVLFEIRNNLENITSDIDKNTDIISLKKKLKVIVKKIYEYMESIKRPRSPISSKSNENHNGENSVKSEDSILDPNNIIKQYGFQNIPSFETSSHSSSNSEVIKYKSGIYEGEILNGKRHGNGTMTYKNNFEYKGEWKNDKKEGIGEYYNKTNRDKYRGDFKNDKAEGKGKSFYDNGDTYEGDYKNWNKEGKGVYKYNNGDMYEGEFKKDLIDGYGTYIYKNGSKYIGEFRKGSPEGLGAYIYISGDKYEGKVKKWNKEGKGVFYYNNGDRYEGDFMNDVREGKGIYY